MYARPANSGPGRTFVMGLPYLLGDKDPRDPIKGWDKTWAYLKELGEYIEYYPAGTSADDEGARRRHARHDRLARPAGTSIRAISASCRRRPRSAPSKASTGSQTRTTWCMPKGVSNDKLKVLLDLMTFLLQAEAAGLHL